MNRKFFPLALILCVALAGVACEPFNKLTATKIKDILERPHDYEDKEITIHGTVTESASILIAKYFVLQNSTGSIKVLTDRVLPKNGEQLSVTGHTASIEIGPDLDRPP